MSNNVSRLPVPYLRRAPQPALETHPPVAITRAIRGPALLGGTLIVLFIGGFVTWSLLAPIASGAVASGVISPDGSRRTVQHLEGGIIADIKAHDGDYVEKGQPVMTLQSVQASATTEGQREEYLTLLASQARLYAEVTLAKEVT
ncbi:MAG TPA: hypothetical protein VL147_23350, partial [Devosia sp.]|nr:hypothetical protein [Devosia sp.]